MRTWAWDGDRFESPVLGLYRIQNGKLARAQMFYFDTAAVVEESAVRNSK